MNEKQLNIDMKRSGLKIKSLIHENGYSVKEIQDYLQLSCPQPIYRWFKGHTMPSIDNLYRLSVLLDVHMETFLVRFEQNGYTDVTYYIEVIKNNSIKHRQYERMELYYHTNVA